MFSTRDVFLVAGMVFVIIMMNGIFLHSGIQGDEYEESQMPELNLTAAQIDLTPNTVVKDPGAPSLGYISPREDFDGAYDSNTWLTSQEDFFLEARAFGSYTEVALSNTTTVGDIDNVQLENVSETKTLSGQGWTVDVTLVEKTGDSTADGLWVVQYEIDSQPTADDGDWISRIPLVGSLYSSGNALASTVGWIGAMLYYGITWIVGGFISTVATIGILAVYVVSLIAWISSTYTAIIGAAPGWSSLIVSLPGIVISLEMAKGFVAIMGASNWI